MLGGMLDLVHILPDKGSGRVGGLLQNEVAVSDDGCEQVVEVVSDPTCQLADRLHLLRLPQLLVSLAKSSFGGLPLG